LEIYIASVVYSYKAAYLTLYPLLFRKGTSFGLFWACFYWTVWWNSSRVRRETNEHTFTGSLQ